MSDVFRTIVLVVSHTPPWVWVLYCLLLFLGAQRTRDSSVSLLRDLVLPLVVTGLAVWSLVAAGLAAVPIMALGLVAQALFDVNVFGVLRMTNSVLPAMRRQGKGRIINLSSVLGLIPAPYSAVYSSTKHAIEGYSESLDHELRTFGIRVVLVEPAYTRTAFEENLARPDRLLGIYGSARAGMNVITRKVIETGDAPEVVARTTVEAAAALAPKRRYAAGKMARQVSLLRRFVPESAFDKSLRKQNGLPA